MFEYLICRHLIGVSLLFFEFFELFNKKILFFNSTTSLWGIYQSMSKYWLMHLA